MLVRCGRVPGWARLLPRLGLLLLFLLFFRWRNSIISGGTCFNEFFIFQAAEKRVSPALVILESLLGRRFAADLTRGRAHFAQILQVTKNYLLLFAEPHAAKQCETSASHSNLLSFVSFNALFAG